MTKIQCVLSRYCTSFHQTIYKGTNTCVAAPKLIKANYQVTHLQAFAEDSVFCIFFFSSEKKGKQKRPVRPVKSCTSERQRAFRAFRGDVMGNWVLGETCGKSRNCSGNLHLEHIDWMNPVMQFSRVLFCDPKYLKPGGDSL